MCLQEQITASSSVVLKYLHTAPPHIRICGEVTKTLFLLFQTNTYFSYLKESLAFQKTKQYGLIQACFALQKQCKISHHSRWSMEF